MALFDAIVALTLLSPEEKSTFVGRSVPGAELLTLLFAARLGGHPCCDSKALG